VKPETEAEMIVLAQPTVALIFGAFMLCAETCNHFQDLLLARSNVLALPWYDWAAGVFLVYAAVQSRRNWITGRPIQIAAWAFVLSLLSGAFFRELEDWISQSPEAVGNGGLVPLAEGPYVLIIAILSALALGGLVSTIRASRTRS
jgi:hypothetical protein